MRVRAYIDGFNLYYRALKKTPHKWLNLGALIGNLLHPDDRVDLIHYFTARVSPRAGHPNAPRDQQAYLTALRTLPNIKITYGRFLPKTIRRPLVTSPANNPEFVMVRTAEEKGSDVNLAVHMLNDGLRDRYDAALVFSQDTDLCECLSLVREAGKEVGLVCLDGKQANPRLAQSASFIKHLTPARLAAAQFPSILNHGGKQIARPQDW